MIPNLGSLSTIKAPTGLTSVVKNLTGLAQIKGMDSVISEIQKVPQLVEPLSKLGDIVKCRYTFKDGEHIVSIFNSDGSRPHAIVVLK